MDDGRVSIGNSVMFRAERDHQHDRAPPSTRIIGCRARTFPCRSSLRDGVWIGANVVVMPGVTIGKNSVIGAEAS